MYIVQIHIMSFPHPFSGSFQVVFTFSFQQSDSDKRLYLSWYLSFIELYNFLGFVSLLTKFEEIWDSLITFFFPAHSHFPLFLGLLSYTQRWAKVGLQWNHKLKIQL